MSTNLQSSLMLLLSKLAPQSLRSLASAMKIKIYPCHRNLAMVFAIWLRVTYTMMCSIKWSQKTKTFTTLGGWSNSIVVSILVKSMCSNSKGTVRMMVALGVWYKCLQVGHTNCSWLLHSASAWPFQATRTCHVASTEFATDPGVQHLGVIHSWQLLNEP